MLSIAYFADDFTGSTDELELLVRAGFRTRLFLEPPTLAQCESLEAVGVAGVTRALAPDAMEAVLLPAFAALRDLGPRHVHYKVCSTFDSSPSIGSIGRAIDVGSSVFGGRLVPVLAAAPGLGRYSAFGTLFARYGIGSRGAIHRLDRHPSVSRHPVTPMTEADLRVHLSKQTEKRIGLLDVTQLELPLEARAAALADLAAEGCEVVLFDALNASHIDRIGALIDSLVSDAPLFSVGSSGIASALAAKLGAHHHRFPRLAHAVPNVLAVSGSCSPVTAGQIEWARAHGFEAIQLDPSADSHAAQVESISSALRAGRSVVAYTSLGEASANLPSDRLGTALGRLVRECLAGGKVGRVVIMGGDTSSYAARALGLVSLEHHAPLVPGAPVCRAHAPGSPADGVEFVFKGGQVGAVDFLGHARKPRGHV